MSTCGDCGGTGFVLGGPSRGSDCPACQGSGSRVADRDPYRSNAPAPTGPPPALPYSPSMLEAIHSGLVDQPESPSTCHRWMATVDAQRARAEAAEAKAKAFHDDWYAAKSEFGAAAARVRREADAALARAEAAEAQRDRARAEAEGAIARAEAAEAQLEQLRAAVRKARALQEQWFEEYGSGAGLGPLMRAWRAADREVDALLGGEGGGG